MKKQQGFTLIELMIVVAIIGVLSAIAVPAYQNYVAKSETASAVGTLRGLLTNIDMYQQEHAGTFPPNTALGDIGATANMNQLGTITLTQKTGGSPATPTGGGMVEFVFTSGALDALNAKVKYEKTTAGWVCKQDKIPSDAQANSCTTAY
ncbi:prepilin-type N-terminal cleavage/methylation domain-containing protein [Photobacterium phosphoreum]|uniref:prepilin-type N-terminal cleavage/methylation domain-containing protein n=1 Tax=Photobacterium phosphoreum TaxID=659 RepID=UPI001E49F624|nr:pilin [Photobacterium phosphoreum]MCD9484313.1 prepilin-type N-terminal cleavage/methylation domain-containing protein [Photobacterium phosphoreum]